MEYSVDYDEHCGICTLHVSGIVTRPEDSKSLQIVTKELRETRGYSRFLLDFSNATVAGGVMETYEAGSAPVVLGLDPLEYRVALVYATESPEAKFLEDVLVNRGYDVRVFGNDTSAHDWLTADAVS